MADRSMRHPKELIEDVLEQIDNFYFSINFIVINTTPVTNLHLQIPVILDIYF